MKKSILLVSIISLLLSCNRSTESQTKDATLALQNAETEENDLNLYSLDDWDDDDDSEMRKDTLLAEMNKDLLENKDYLDRKVRIVHLKKELGKQMEAIGRDISLTGYEKAVKKRELKLKYRQELYKILGDGTITTPQGKVDFIKIDKLTQGIDEELDALEVEYDKEKYKLESMEDHMAKREYKIKKHDLKAEYKTKKSALKRKKDEIIYKELYK